MGTPEFAVPILKQLLAEHEVLAVLTQPDRKAGRSRRVEPSPVKRVALDHGIAVLQPLTLRRSEAIEPLRALAPEVIVVAAYGLILPRAVLDLPKHGCLNVHASLLPKHRGASPIAAAILAGDTETGVTVMLMDEGMDSGPILAQRSVAIAPDDTTQSLGEKLARLGASLLAEVLPRWLSGEIVPTPQDASRATQARLIRKEDGRIDWSQPAIEIERQVRAYLPWPSAHTSFRGEMLKVLRARVAPGQGQPGKVMRLPEGIAVATGDGVLVLDEVQLAGKKPLSSEAFVRGQRDFVGSVLQ
jgi:methionyl-tRNA formyltransferase